MSASVAPRLFWGNVPHFGSPEHFWHYLLGYLLPMMRFLMDRRQASPDSLRILDCGPHMNRLAAEVLSHICIRPMFDRSLRVECDIEAPARPVEEANEGTGTQAHPLDGERIVLQRWDVRILTRIDPGGLKPVLLETREAVTALLEPWSCCDGRIDAGKYLILERSPEPPFYRPGGGAVVAGYGAGRRVLHGTREAQAVLEAAGVPCVVYEPGAHNLACQANHFAKCRGAIGVRGAELANVIWMAPAARVMIFQSAALQTGVSPAAILAGLLGQDWIEFPHDGAVSPVLDAAQILRHLGKDVL